MDDKPKMGGLFKTGMLALALIFDAIQYLTPGYTDTLVTAIAVLVFAMIFFEKGMLTMRGTGALKIFRLVVPMAELIIGHLPGIFLTVWIQIKIAEITAKVLPDSAQETLKSLKMGRNVKSMVKNKDFIKTRSKKMARVASRRYGKGRRGAHTLSQRPGSGVSSAQRRLQDKKL